MAYFPYFLRMDKGSLLPPLRRPVTAENMLQQVDWARLGRGVLRRVWLIVTLAVIFTLLGVAGAVKGSRTKYSARASLLYRTDRQKQALAASGSSFAIKGLSRSTAVSLLRRTSNMDAVCTRLQLPMTPDELRWRIQAKSEKNSEIILLTIEDMPGADLAVKAINEAIRIALEDNRDFYRSQAVQAAAQFNQQALQSRQELAVLGDQLSAFQASNRLVEAAADTTAFLDSVAAVSERLSAARIAYNAQLVRIENFRKIIAGLPDEVLRDSYEDNPLKRRITNTEMALMEARTKFGPDNPRVQTLEDEIKEMRRTLADKTFDENRERVFEPNPAKRQFEQELLRLEVEKTVLEQTVAQVTTEMAEVEKKFAYLPQQQLELAGFIQRRAAASEMSQALAKSAESARLAGELDLADFESLEPARTAASTRSRLAGLLPFLGLLAGVIGGVLLAGLLEFLDPALRTVSQAELAYSIPCLGAVPVTGQDTLEDAFLPVCRSLYPRLKPDDAASAPVWLAVMSARNGEGKSTLAFQLARYWAGLGAKTAYLDFDAGPNPVLRMPANAGNLMDCLSGQAAWEDTSFAQDGVTCAKLTAHAGDLPERLHGGAMARLLDTLRARYACVILDTPALLENRNAEPLAALAGQSLWVIDASRTPRATVNLAFDDLDRARIRPLGMILNFLEPARAARGRG